MLEYSEKDFFEEQADLQFLESLSPNERSSLTSLARALHQDDSYCFFNETVPVISTPIALLPYFGRADSLRAEILIQDLVFGPGKYSPVEKELEWLTRDLPKDVFVARLTIFFSDRSSNMQVLAEVQAKIERLETITLFSYDQPFDNSI